MCGNLQKDVLDDVENVLVRSLHLYKNHLLYWGFTHGIKHVSGTKYEYIVDMGR